MADIRRYQPRRQSSSASQGRRWIVVLLVVLLIALGWKFGFMRSSPTADRNENANTGIRLLTDGAQSTNVAVESNTNNSVNTNIGITPVASAGSWNGFSVEKCPNAISSFGTSKQVVLTIGLSAANESATQVLAAVQNAHVPADFFVSGAFATKNASLVQSIAQAGFAVYSQSYDSTNLTSLTDAGIVSAVTKAESAISSATGVSPKPILRPPSGDYNAAVLQSLRSQGYCAVLWTVDAYDWQDGMTVAQSQERVMASLTKQTGGSIVALHAGYDITPELVTNLVTTLKSAGYELVNLATLLHS